MALPRDDRDLDIIGRMNCRYTVTDFHQQCPYARQPKTTHSLPSISGIAGQYLYLLLEDQSIVVGLEGLVFLLRVAASRDSRVLQI